MSASNDQASTAPATSPKGTESVLNDELVRDYLKEHADFLQRHPDLLDHLHVSHASGSAVSLVEKQVAVLRERNIDMRHRLNTLTGNARENDKLYEQTRTLLLKLLDCRSVDALYQTFIDAMADEFAIEHASMILFGDPDSSGVCRTESQENAKLEIGPLLKGQKAVCGALRKEELNYLFPDGGEVGSAALMPLSNGEPLGLIAVGSSDASHYSSSMGTLFLSHIAEVIVRLLPRLPDSGA
jgi:uncharacterized protein YigA (DUF484 family)